MKLKHDILLVVHKVLLNQESLVNGRLELSLSFTTVRYQRVYAISESILNMNFYTKDIITNFLENKGTRLSHQ